MNEQANFSRDTPTTLDEVRETIRRRALSLGFAAVGFASLGRPVTFDQFEDWIARGMHGTMGYLEDHREIRGDTARLEPGMRSAVVLLTSYESAPYDLSPSSPGTIARYALGDDYHRLLRDKMRSLGEFIGDLCQADVALRPAVDSAPILERDLAAKAGLGWVGKSAMVLNESLGTYHFISELFVDVDLSEPDRSVPNRCGRCTRCIDACPTGAIVAPYRVDATRCISYLTIELRGAIPRELRPLVADHLFGCDICQEVCPWNRFAQPASMLELEPREALRNLRAEDILMLDQAEFSALFRDSSMKRAKRRGLARNAAVVLGNERRAETVPVLLDAIARHDEPLVRGHAAWALAQFDGGTCVPALRALEAALARETDAGAIEELAWAHAALSERRAPGIE